MDVESIRLSKMSQKNCLIARLTHHQRHHHRMMFMTKINFTYR